MSAVLPDLLRWLSGEPWLGVDGVPTLVAQHVLYALVPTVVAMAIALPIGLWSGHTGRGGLLAINVANIGRAIPSFGLILLTFTLAGFGFVPVYLTLVALAIPPILTNTYVGVRQVDPEVREAAAGMGLTGPQILRQVEVPMALPVIMAGVRTSAVQVVATATLAAVVGLGGLGRPIINGLAQNVQASPAARTLVIVGAVAVAVLAVLTELGLGLLERLVVPRGLAGARQAGPGGVGSAAAA
jgi:osmoprotectant transport system permease protein